MNSRLRAVFGAALALALIAASWLAFRPAEAPQPRASVVGLAPRDPADRAADGFARATSARAFVFPQDHAAHPDYALEWWYFVGNLSDASGRHFGYQFTIFRNALAPSRAAGAQPAGDASAWTSDQLYFAHFAVTDSAAGAHVEAEKFSRGAAGLAGASVWSSERAAWEGGAWRVWVEDWSAEALDPGVNAIRLRAADGAIAIALELTAAKPIVLQGDRGLSQKGPTAGNASYYYSMTRLDTRGTVTTPSGSFAVNGSSWLDREWSTSLLEKDAVGWDWFALQLDDGRDVKAFRIRNRDGSVSWVDGALIDKDGSPRRIRPDDLIFDVRETWTADARDRRAYPVKWRLTIPSAELVLDVEARLPDQEMNVSTTYWEGAVRVTGSAGGRPVGGVGYLEMTGYGSESIQDRL